MSALAKTNTVAQEQRAQQRLEALSILEIAHQQLRSDEPDLDQIDEWLSAVSALVEAL